MLMFSKTDVCTGQGDIEKRYKSITRYNSNIFGSSAKNKKKTVKVSRKLLPQLK
jgi:hypothetical protein